MARKQSEYLASLLAEEAEAPEALPAKQDETESPLPPSPAPVVQERAIARAGLSLLGRENALARVASGEVRQITQLQIDPARVRIWEGNARIQAQLSEESCRDLIDSIIAEGGQKVPAVVRHLNGDPDHDYELIAGTRRHFAISWLRNHNYPDMRLLAQVSDLDDEAAFRLADIENRARKDISDIERARNYAAALDRHYGGKAVRMAERLNVSKGWLSKMLRAASLPDAVLDAFATPHDLPLNPAYKLAQALEDKDRAKAIRREAGQIVGEQVNRQERGLTALPGSTVLARLMGAQAIAGPPPKDWQMEVPGQHGRTILAVKSVTRQGITLHLPMASGASDDQIAGAVRQVLDTLRLNGVTVR